MDILGRALNVTQDPQLSEHHRGLGSFHGQETSMWVVSVRARKVLHPYGDPSWCAHTPGMDKPGGTVAGF